jgi:hypothetical protein
MTKLTPLTLAANRKSRSLNPERGTEGLGLLRFAKCNRVEANLYAAGPQAPLCHARMPHIDRIDRSGVLPALRPC